MPSETVTKCQSTVVLYLYSSPVLNITFKSDDINIDYHALCIQKAYLISISIVSYAILPRDQFQVGSITGLKIDKDLSFLQIRSKALPTPTC